jgi:REP element-mobilizing transposase RayT
MSYHTRISALIHYVFSTKDRLPLIPVKMQPQLWSYIGGIARANAMKALAVGGMGDHAHVLVSLPPTVTIGKAMQLIKAGSSKWMHERMGTRFE